MKRSHMVYELATALCKDRRAYINNEPRKIDLADAELALYTLEKLGMLPPKAIFSRKIVINGEEQFHAMNKWEAE